MSTAAVAYSTTYGGYPSILANMGPSATPTSTAADLIDSQLAGGIKSGYTLGYAGTGTPVTAYTATAVPVNPGVTGFRTFFTDQTGIIRANAAGAAPSVADTPVQQ